jgi:hypothetical protein
MQPVTSRILLGSVIVPLLLLGAAVPTAASGSRTYVAKCQRAVIKPHSIVFACGDGGFYVKKLHWRHWSSRWAVASGVFHENDCRPDCAGGTFHRRHGVLLLTRRLWCTSVSKFVYRRVTIRYTRRSRANLKWTHDFQAQCPF